MEFFSLLAASFISIEAAGPELWTEGTCTSHPAESDIWMEEQLGINPEWMGKRQCRNVIKPINVSCVRSSASIGGTIMDSGILYTNLASMLIILQDWDTGFLQPLDFLSLATLQCRKYKRRGKTINAQWNYCYKLLLFSVLFTEPDRWT